jgi:YidC/Oxa1 family membrane protein insertase
MKSISHSIGSIFQPIFHIVGWMLATIYGVIPNYAVAIVLLTVIIMAILTPFTVKSTRSMKAMQKLQPEIKKLQQKYKGPENRQLLNQEMMELYKQEGVNPLGGCLPMFLQTPFLIILYGCIKGLSNTVTSKAGVITAEPRYIPTSSKMYQNLIQAHGQVKVWGMDLSMKPFSSHGSFWAAIPFFVFVIIAVALQYFQMQQMNTRSKKQGQVIPSQQQTMQRIFPIIFAYIYLIVPAAVVVYMIVSSGIRIITQTVIYNVDEKKERAGTVDRYAVKSKGDPDAPKEIPAANPTDDDTIPVKSTTPKPSTPKPTQTRASRPAPKPVNQQRSKAKRKRKAR